MLQALIDEFEALSSELLAAVRAGDEAAVDRIDVKMQPLVQRIFNICARNREEALQQLDFFARLAVRNCDDDGSVSHYTEFISALFDRYLASFSVSPTRMEAVTPAVPDGYDSSLHELLLDSVPERVAVVGLDYRYIYTNQRNADFHAAPPSAFIGKHLTDMIDGERFRRRAKPRLDQCFAGARVSYNYEAADAGGRMFEVNCRMTPFVGPDKNIIGAVIVLSMQPMFARIA
jgi:PAS domain-containing protein